jgi:hypothetical protein
MPTARVYIQTPYAGGAEPLTCELNRNNFGGVQIEVEGFNIEDADILLHGANGVTQAPVPLEETGVKIVKLGVGYSWRGISLGGLSAGDYQVRFVPLNK